MPGLPLKEAWGCFNRRLLLTCSLVAVSPFNYGFDQQGFGSIQSMDAFQQQFGEYDPKEATYFLPTDWLAMFNGLPFVCFAIGIIAGSMISRHFGRRMCIFIMSLWAICCACILITSKKKEQVLAGRCLNFFYVGMEISVIPVYQSEITPRKVRGVVVGTYHLALLIGGLAINLITTGTQFLDGNKQWMVPFGLYFTIPTLVCSTIWFLPESPRWLILQDRPEKARDNLRKLRVGAFTDDEIEAEFHYMLAGIQAENESPSFWRGDIFKGVNLKRTLITLGCNFFLQTTGQQFSSTYGAIFVKSTKTMNQLYYQVMSSCINIIASIIAVYLSDVIGRRKLIFIGSAFQSTALLLMGGLGTIPNPSLAVRSATVAMLAFMGIGYTTGWAAVTQTLNAEIPNTKLRDATFRSGQIVAVSLNLAMTYSLPYMLNAPYGNLHSKVGFIFGSVCALSVVFAYFFVPDCRGISLEVVDRLFAEGVPPRAFHKTDVSTLPIPVSHSKEDLELKEASATTREQA